MNTRFLDWIWHVRGSLALAPGQSVDDAFDRLDPLFHQAGTSHDRTTDTLIFRKKDQAAQDRMSVFDGGILRIERDVAGLMLRYHLTSRALLFCFLAPLLFLGFAQATVILPKIFEPAAETKPKKPEVAKPPKKLNPIDAALGAPAPDPPKKDKKPGEDDKKPSPTPGYIFAGIFAALYVIGRILESRRVKRLFRKSLLDA
ncbi:hypothetical protein [Sphingomonas montana]|uniref:hypothetical protein n=1 Tax=Sphingomonas montana TaxID=1843236 RepID=UPI00096D6E6A|nr:hypothetical protein [Sphingomonas montana]